MLSAGWEVEWECSCVEFHKLGFQGEETRWRNALKPPEDKERGGTGDTVAQYYRYYHFQYIFIPETGEVKFISVSELILFQ